MDNEGKRADSSTRWATLVFAGLAVVIMGVIFVNSLRVISRSSPEWVKLVPQHFAAIVGLPTAAVASFGLVVFLRQTEGPAEFEGLGFKFKGAAGQVVMWTFCFLIIAGAIKLVW